MDFLFRNNSSVYSGHYSSFCVYLQLIPVGSDILLNMDSVLCDPDVFDEPYTFKPERFLTGDIEQKKQRAMYFGIGKLQHFWKLKMD